MSDFKLDWEEHRGLCRYVARITVRLDSRLKPHFQEIIYDLESKLWQICEGCTYEPGKSKPSTYLTTALLKHCERTIRRQYIGSHVSWKSMQGVSIYNISEVGHQTLHSNDDARDIDEREVREVALDILKEMRDEDAEVYKRLYFDGEIHKSIGKVRVATSRRRVKKFVSELKASNPQKYQDCIATLGRKAV